MRRYLLILKLIVLFVLLIVSDNLYSQNNYSAKVIQPNPISGTSICIVSVNNENKNIVVWDKINDNFVDYVKIYKESTQQTGQWDSIGYSYSANSSLFVDSISEPMKQSYRYKISSVDRCGNETELSSSHKTMNLSVLKSLNNSYSLIWDEYEGFPVNSYRIYRGITPDDLKLIGRTTADNFNYNDSYIPEGAIYYQIEVLSDNTCNVSLLKSSTNYNNSRSNIVSNLATQIQSLSRFNEISIYPNPYKDITTIRFSNPNNEPFEFNVFDVSGKKVRTMKISSGQFDFRRDNLSKGIYYIELKGQKSTLKSRMIIIK